ncbi:MAG: type II toxin-antitoxin system VapC family toxin [Burkholderiaceae bacterium]|nr:type II toxin-antitoxin system VapC family toxin [Burkholderiaceae bacterium]
MVLVDTNVIFALLVRNTPWSESARELYGLDPDWRTESHALVEISNVLSRYVRVRELTVLQAVAVMTEADQRLQPRLIAAVHVDALRMALKYKVSAYDARFLLSAAGLGVKLVTEDVKLRAAVPSLTQSLHDALAACSLTAPTYVPAHQK